MQNRVYVKQHPVLHDRLAEAASRLRDYSTFCAWPVCSAVPASSAEETDERTWLRSRRAKRAIQTMPILIEMRSSRPADSPPCTLAATKAKATKKASMRTPATTEKAAQPFH